MQKIVVIPFVLPTLFALIPGPVFAQGLSDWDYQQTVEAARIYCKTTKDVVAMGIKPMVSYEDAMNMWKARDDYPQRRSVYLSTLKSECPELLN